MPPKNIHTLGSGSSRPKGSGSSQSSNDNSSFSAVWKTIPPVTRAFGCLLALITSVNQLQLINAGYLYFQWNETFKYFQLWRLITSFFILPPRTIPALLEFYNICSKSLQLEQEHFFICSKDNPTIDHTYYICFCFLVIANVTAFIFGPMFPMVLTGAFSSCLTFTWAVDNTNSKVMFYGMPIYGKYFPIIEFAVCFIFGERNIIVYLIGMVTAYLYLCLDTRSFGPFWGCITRKHPSYGRAPGGKFGAPGWFIYIYNIIFMTGENKKRVPSASTISSSTGPGGIFGSGFKGEGSKLGGGSTGRRNINPRPNMRSAQSKNTDTKSSGFSSGAGSGNFQGLGQRVGSKD